MSRPRMRGRPAAARVRARRPILAVETLEDRNLLNAGLGSLLATPAYDPSDILVRLRPEFAGAPFTLTGNETGSPSQVASALWKIDLNPGDTVADALANFRVDPRVEFAQPDYRIQVQLTPNDPYFTSNQLWGLNQIGAPSGWNRTTGSGSVVVAIIDTGIDFNHPDLAANVWTNTREIAGNGRDDDGNGIVDDVYGANFTSLSTTTGNVLDDNSHGSHVAGIIGAVGNNGTGVSGVAWHVQLMALKFLDANGGGYTSGAVRAIDYAIAHGAKIINASWGGGGFDQALSDAIGRAKQAGVIFVAAAGNSGTNNDGSPFYPAGINADNVVAVAASNSSDQPASFSNYGRNTVDLYAPGVGIWSTVRNGGYASYSGTSMATPFVTGALALLKSAHPDWNYHQLITRLQTTVNRLPQFSNVAWGGRLNVAAALADAAPPVSSAHPAITGTIASRPSQGQFYKVRLIFNKAVDPASFSTTDVALSRPSGGIGISGVAAVSGTGNTQFDVTFATQTSPGTYRLTVGPHIKDLAGNEMTAAFSASFTVRSTSASFSSGALSTAIRDFHTATSTINVNQDLTIGKLTVNVNANHTWVGDLVVKLRGPDGTTVTLFNRHGGSGDNLHATFDDAAVTSIGAGAAPFQGAFRPDRALSTFNGLNARGAWQLIVQDKAVGDEGTLTGWSLTLQAASASAQSARPSSVDDPHVAAPAGASAVRAASDTIFAGSLLQFLQTAITNVRPILTSTPQGANNPKVDSIVVTASVNRALDRIFAQEGGGQDADAAAADLAWEDLSLEDGATLAEVR